MPSQTRSQETGEISAGRSRWARQNERGGRRGGRDGIDRLYRWVASETFVGHDHQSVVRWRERGGVLPVFTPESPFERSSCQHPVAAAASDPVATSPRVWRALAAVGLGYLLVS